MPRLQHEVKNKKDAMGIHRHDSYKLVIPYVVALQFDLQSKAILYATASAKTRIIRLYKKPTQDSVPVKTRQKSTKIYKNNRYYSVQVTVPILFVRDLHLAKNQLLDISCLIRSIVIKPAKS